MSVDKTELLYIIWVLLLHIVKNKHISRYNLVQCNYVFINHISEPLKLLVQQHGQDEGMGRNQHCSYQTTD